jgi:hypothetical protein
MSTIRMSEETNNNRRRFLRNATMTLAAAGLASTMRSADAQSSQTSPAQVPQIRPGTNTSFGSLKQINAGLLNVGYAEAGPANGPAVVLLHGWPYDIHSFVDVTPLLASAMARRAFSPAKRCGTPSSRPLPSTSSL